MPLYHFFLILPPIVGFHFVLLILFAITEISEKGSRDKSAHWIRYPVLLLGPLILPGLITSP